jgi:hypothetical protein
MAKGLHVSYLLSEPLFPYINLPNAHDIPHRI